MIPGTRRFGAAFDHWLFERPDPRVCSLLRIGFAILLSVYLVMWWREAERWFSDAGVLRAETMREASELIYPSLLWWLPNDPLTIHICLAICLGQTLLLGLGVASRWQAACIFVWLVSFQHRNMIICDGQDVLIRLLSFYLIFMPLDYAWSLGRWWRQAASGTANLTCFCSGRARALRSVAEISDYRAARAAPLPKNNDIGIKASGIAPPPPSAWGLRLVQLQVTAIYLSTAWEKFQGVTWRDGTALFYVARMDDLYGRFGLPEMLFETPWILHSMTWGVLALEAALPLLLWWRPTRWLGVLAAASLHLAIEATMNIYLFEWLMLLCLVAFVDPRWLSGRRLKGRGLAGWLACGSRRREGPEGSRPAAFNCKWH